jgi:NAD(P)-dependent dehydrogenase (short-subunit alcohol dehydrogenase family)
VGSVTVVTGGSRGIGAATARRLAEAGHDVAVSYHSEAGAAETVLAQVRAAGRRGVALRADVACEADVERLFDTVADQLGTVTGLVNNAGVTSPAGRLVDLSTDDLRRVVDVNVVGAILCARRAAQDMARSRGGAGGAIVNVSSGASTLGGAGDYVHYAASKAAVDTLTIGLSQELAADGIRVNSVSPGVIRTEIHARGTRDPDRVDRAAAGIPMGRPGEPDEIAAPIVWLLGPDASYTTGAILRVAGGR